MSSTPETNASCSSGMTVPAMKLRTRGRKASVSAAVTRPDRTGLDRSGLAGPGPAGSGLTGTGTPLTFMIC